MGANKNDDRQKCGDILISSRTIKNKAKVFTFHCALCSMNCDQLKKFSKHLDKHLHYFDNDVENTFDEQDNDASLLFDPEELKKVEEQFDIERINKNDSKVSSDTSSEVHKDPLETGNPHKKELSCDEELTLPFIKTENGVASCESTNRNMLSDKSRNIQESQIDYDYNEYKNTVTFKDSSSDDCSNYSNDTDFNVKKEQTTSKNVKNIKDGITKRKSLNPKKRKKSPNEININDPKRTSNNNKPKKKRRVIVASILPFLIQQYKKYKLLWQVDDIAFGIKNKKYEIYGKIAEALKIEANENISLDDINYHINYLNELYSKDKERELKCKMEKEEFLPEYEYYTEMSFLSDSQGPFLCIICNEILPKYDPYCQHIAQHNETQPFKCPSCDMMFPNYPKYLRHKKLHLGIVDFHCDICGKGYLFKSDLERHVPTHTSDKPYLCQICGTGFKALNGYDNHIRRHEKRFRHQCHICKRGFNQLYALNNHVKSHLNIRDVICTICGKGFVHTMYLKRHELIHGTEKPYKCNECGKAFFQACGLRAHRKNHHS